MKQTIIGRHRECEIIKNVVSSENAEFVAIFGRRRIGKTFLIKEYFKDKFTFYFTGIYRSTRKTLLREFHYALTRYSGKEYSGYSNWFDAFRNLRSYLEQSTSRKPFIVFLDELPWFDTPRSDFRAAFEYFWNSWGATERRLKLFVCGSATTWMRDQLIGDHGGLYNRVTRQIKLGPFNLLETEQLLQSNGIRWNRYQILECQMVLGGIPMYLGMLEKGFSLAQNVDMLFFDETAKLKMEYNFLFRSLFNESNIYRQLVEELSLRNMGKTRQELMTSIGLPAGGVLSNALKNLRDSDFLREYSAPLKRERDKIYQLTDLFTLFYLSNVKNYRGGDNHHWCNMLDAPARRAWSGYAFEQVCLNHLPQIKEKLGISGIQADAFAWHGKNAQIDLVIDRRDQVINLCEMKYSTSLYEIDKKYDTLLRSRQEQFRTETKTRKALHLTMVTTYGLTENEYRANIQNEITLDDLFREPR